MCRAMDLQTLKLRAGPLSCVLVESDKAKTNITVVARLVVILVAESRPACALRAALDNKVANAQYQYPQVRDL